MLDADELAGMRAETQGLTLTDTAVIMRPSLVSNGGGRGGATWAQAGTCPARLWSKPTNRDMQEAVQPGASALQAVVLWTALLPVGIDVRSTDRLIIAGQTLEVADTDAGRSEALVMQAICRRIG